MAILTRYAQLTARPFAVPGSVRPPGLSRKTPRSQAAWPSPTGHSGKFSVSFLFFRKNLFQRILYHVGDIPDAGEAGGIGEILID